METLMNKSTKFGMNPIQICQEYRHKKEEETQRGKPLRQMSASQGEISASQGERPQQYQIC